MLARAGPGEHAGPSSKAKTRRPQGARAQERRAAATTINVGVIGTGNMGAHHAMTLHRYVNGAVVTMLYDADRGRAGELSRAIPGSVVASGAMALVEDRRTDALIIASPDDTHAELVRAALAAGKPVMCEKPLAPSLAECVQVVRAEQAAVADGRRPLISLGFMRRFDPGYVAVKESVGRRELGAPLVLHCESRGVTSGPGTTTASAVIGSAVHELDVVSWLLDEPIVSVAWHRPRASVNAEGFQDPQLLVLRTARDVLAIVELFLNARYGYEVRCEVVCETGTLALNYARPSVANATQMHYLSHPLDWRERFADAYRLELQAWARSIAHGCRSPLAGAVDATRAAAVADAVIASIGRGAGETAVEYPQI